MRTIESIRLLEEPMPLEADDALHFGGGRDMPITTDAIVVLTPEHTAQIEDDVTAGLAAFGAMEQTLAMRKLGRPTAIARIDSTIDPETGRIHPYEVEDRPGGMGVVSEMAKRVADVALGGTMTAHLEETFGRLPVVKQHNEATEGDDRLLLPVEIFTPTKLKVRPEQPILVRADRHKMATHPHLRAATEQSIAPIIEEGKRQYRFATGHADLVTSPSALPEDASFVLKGLQGTQCKNVLVRLNENDTVTHGNRETATLTKARRMVEQQGAVIMERFVPGIPVEMKNAGIGHMILRVFCLVDPDGAKAIGGAFLARPGHLVHGAHDAVSGLVLTERDAS